MTLTAADAARIADVYRRHLPPGRLMHFRVDGLDRLGIPVVTARLVLATGGSFEGIGYGATDEEALVGALGELSEEAHADAALAAMPRVVSSYATLVRERGPRRVLDPATVCLPAGSDWRPETALAWVEGRWLAGGDPVLVPECLACDAPQQLRDAHAPLVVPITNGLGAGLSREQAIVHGLLELLQRDGNVVSYRALDRGIAIDLDDLRDPELRRIVDHDRACGIDVVAKIASTAFGMLNVYVVGLDREPLVELPLRLTACGEAVHPDRDRALRKALLEYAGSRARKSFRHGPLARIAEVASDDYLACVLPGIDPRQEEPRALEAMLHWLTAGDAHLRRLLVDRGIFAVHETRPLSALPTVGPGTADDPATRLALVVGRLAEEGLEPIVVDCSPAGGEVFVVKTIVPGLESETLSYHRIGERGVRRLLERGSVYVAVGGDPGGAFAHVTLAASAEARLGGSAWLDVPGLDALVGELYALYREPGGHSAPVALAQRAA